jgi:hypothetical protein
MNRLAAVVLAIALLPQPAAAQSAVAVLGEFGLIDGVWATDCSKDPSPMNWYARYSMSPSSEARLTFSLKRDRTGDFGYVIRQARRFSANETLLEVDVVAEKRQLEVLLRVDGERYHTISVKQPDGGYQIKDGKFTDDGSESPGYNRCR